MMNNKKYKKALSGGGAAVSASDAGVAAVENVSVKVSVRTTANAWRWWQVLTRLASGVAKPHSCHRRQRRAAARSCRQKLRSVEGQSIGALTYPPAGVSGDEYCGASTFCRRF